MLFRAFYALPDTIKGADGQPVNALLGTANLILREIEEHSPRAVVLCFGPDAADYRVELFDASVDPPRSLWSMSGLRRGENATLIVAVPRSFLSPGIYRLTIYGGNGGGEDLVNHYTIRIPTTAR